MRLVGQKVKSFMDLERVRLDMRGLWVYTARLT